MRSFGLLLLSVLASIPAFGGSVITFNGSIYDSSISRYEEGDPFSISFTLADYEVEGDPQPEYGESKYDWIQLSIETAPIYGDVRFTGVEGTYFNPYYPAMRLQFAKTGEGTTQLLLVAEITAPNEGARMGLHVDGDAVESMVVTFDAAHLFPNLGSDPTITPEEYFTTVYGTYAGTAGTSYVLLHSYERFDFQLTEVVIAAVPEPSTMGLLTLAGGALVFLSSRNRKRWRR